MGLKALAGHQMMAPELGQVLGSFLGNLLVLVDLEQWVARRSFPERICSLRRLKLVLSEALAVVVGSLDQRIVPCCCFIVILLSR